MTGIMMLAIGGLAFAVAILWLSHLATRRWQVWPLAILGIAGLATAGTMLAWSIAATLGDHSPRTLDLGSGLTYQRIAVDEPNRQVFHVAIADLDDPCVGFVTSTPGTDGLIDAETGTEFVARTGVALSINVAFFYPINEYPYWDSYPESGDPVTAIGPVVINGDWLGNISGGWNKGLALTAGRLSATVIPGNADFAVSGRSVLVADGAVVASDSEPYPRAVAGVDLETNRLFLIVADGKQPGYADGSTYRAVADFLIGRGVDEAVEFDGGGSATMAATVDGHVELLNRPSHQRIPGRQRPVATHLGITVDPDCP